MGARSHARGAEAERRVADMLNKKFPGHNVKRIGGVERRKWVLPGDLGCIMYDKGMKVCTFDECFFQDFYFEVKNRKQLSVPSWWRKTVDDCPVNRQPVLVWYNKGKHQWFATFDGEERLQFEEWLELFYSRSF